MSRRSLNHKPARLSFGRISTGLLLLLLLITAGVAFWAWQRYAGFADAPLSGLEPGETVMVERGDSLPIVVRKLREAGAREGDMLEWRALARQLGAAGKLQMGEYAIEPGTSPRTLLLAMRDGRVIRHRFTIVEGWNIRELRAALVKAKPLRLETDRLDDEALMKSIGVPGQHPEGRFLPETYLYTRGDSDLDVLKRAHTAMDKALDAAWRRRSADNVLKTPDEMLVLASIVEKESAIASERPQIAGLFARRLKLGMRLETDPTVIYGLGSAYDGDIHKRDLRADNPYNTYLISGLPPTPIAMPGIGALEAVAKPTDGDALFFVAVGDGSGRHLFARTYAEHQANVSAYLERHRAAKSGNGP